MSTHAPRALSSQLRALAGDDAEGNPHLRTMRSAAVVGLVAGLLLLVSGVTTGDVALLVLAAVALLWTGVVQVGWWVVCALIWDRAQD